MHIIIITLHLPFFIICIIKLNKDIILKSMLNIYCNAMPSGTHNIMHICIVLDEYNWDGNLFMPFIISALYVEYNTVENERQKF